MNKKHVLWQLSPAPHLLGRRTVLFRHPESNTVMASVSLAKETDLEEFLWQMRRVANRTLTPTTKEES